MRLRTDLWLATVFVATAMGCDDPYAENGDSDTGAPTEATVDGPRRTPLLEYEDADDFAILNDRSNLRPSDVSHLEYRRRLSLRDRDELLQEMDGVQVPTDEEIGAVSMRWFVTGTGVVVQNPTERPFTVSAYFSATTEPACGVTIPMRVLPAKGSVLLSPRDGGDCVIDRADVTLTDEYGFLANQLVVRAEEPKP